MRASPPREETDMNRDAPATAADTSAADGGLSDAAVWDLEARFWSGDDAFYDAWLAAGALMVFPDPTGILDRAAIVASIRGGPRWTQVHMTERRVARPNAGVVLVAYRFEARMDDGDDAYRGWASSSYARSAGAWSLAFHQQTPVP
jgi:hypothetical protein